MPSLNHGAVQAELIREIGRDDSVRLVSELTLEIDGKRLTPDLCVYRHLDLNFDQDVIRMTQMPLTTVEIMSPTQGSYQIMEHVAAYLAAGVQSAWVVAPTFRSVHIYTKDRPMQSFTLGKLKDSVTGLTADLDKVFR